MKLSKAWLDGTLEETLEPELPICDPHHHLWDGRNVPHWRDTRYLLDEILQDLTCGHNIVSTVYIECASMYRQAGDAAMRPVGETEFVNGIAAMSASGLYGPARIASGIIGFADLTDEAVGEVLDAHIRAGGGRFRGIRHAASWDAHPAIRNSLSEPPQHLFAHEDFRRGFAQLAPRGLSFEGWLYHPQLPDLTDLARAFPDTLMVVNHFGGPLGIEPYQRAQTFDTWAGDFSALASCPNVMAKLGGLQMDINGFGWHERPTPPGSEELAEAIEPYYRLALEQFGIERCLFESNFPVDNLSCSYNVLWNAHKRIASNLSAAEKAALFHDNATRIYRL
ncbi:MAG: amidohydrolase family protein [Pseudomonadota bacterium]